jgi:hypothetical protein
VYPATVTPGATLVVTGRVAGVRGRLSVALQQHGRAGWTTRASGPVTVRDHRFELRWRPRATASPLRVRVAALGGRRLVAVSPARRIHLASSAPGPSIVPGRTVLPGIGIDPATVATPGVDGPSARQPPTAPSDAPPALPEPEQGSPVPRTAA